ncbi:hypothetical protein ACW4YW_05475 [Methylobacillus pratensis]
MLIIDFNKSIKRAFAFGFAKGLSAPLMLHGHFKAPDIHTVELLEIPAISTAKAIKSDWEAVGMDIQSSAQQYGQTTSQK